MNILQRFFNWLDRCDPPLSGRGCGMGCGGNVEPVSKSEIRRVKKLREMEKKLKERA